MVYPRRLFDLFSLAMEQFQTKPFFKKGRLSALALKFSVSYLWSICPSSENLKRHCPWKNKAVSGKVSSRISKLLIYFELETY